jgi:beta-aspartyl-dipeptidase (metallo-type)
VDPGADRESAGQYGSSDFALIRGGQVYAPEPLGEQSILVCAGRIVGLGSFDPAALSAAGLRVETVDANGCLVVPGFVDPHQHLLGAGGEQGFSSRQPEVEPEELVQAGITTVVGCLGTDVTTRHLTDLLARARQLREAGFTAYIYTGGFPVPPATLTGGVTEDLMLIPEVIGVGEVAISDVRSSQPRVRALARLVAQATIGGRMSGKAGVTHFHVGPGPGRLRPLRRLLRRYDVEPGQLYPTHIGRDERLLEEAIELTRHGMFVDLDTVGRNASRWLRVYLERGGPLDRLTVSSDAHTRGGRPEKLRALFEAAVRELELPLEQALLPFTTNVARVLHLPQKGRLGEGLDADLQVLEPESLRLVELFASGRRHALQDRPLDGVTATQTRC